MDENALCLHSKGSAVMLVEIECSVAEECARVKRDFAWNSRVADLHRAGFNWQVATVRLRTVFNDWLTTLGDIQSNGLNLNVCCPWRLTEVDGDREILL